MKTLKTIIFSIALLTIFIPTQAQNLVPNPSFEDTIYCPYIGEMNAIRDWSSYSASPDYFNICADFQYGVPLNSFGYQEPAEGNAYCGIFTYNNYLYPPNPDTLFREMIGAELVVPLTINKKYYVSLKASLSSLDFCASNNIGVLFSTVPHIDLEQVASTWEIQNFAHINYQIIITNTTSWTTISGSFIADSAYRYIIIGNFFNNYNTEVLTFGQDTNCLPYYYIDDICVSEDSLLCDMSTKTENEIQNYVSIYPNPASNILFIENKSSKEINYIIYNSYGEKEKYGISSIANIEIDLSTLSSGIYYIQCILNKKSITKKILIIR